MGFFCDSNRTWIGKKRGSLRWRWGILIGRGQQIPRVDLQGQAAASSTATPSSSSTSRDTYTTETTLLAGTATYHRCYSASLIYSWCFCLRFALAQRVSCVRTSRAARQLLFGDLELPSRHLLVQASPSASQRFPQNTHHRPQKMATAARRVVQTLSAPLCKSAPHRRAPRLTNTTPTHSHQTRAFAASRSALSVSRTRYTIPKDEFTLAEIPQNAFDRAIDVYCDKGFSLSYSDPYTRISSAKCYGVAQRAEMAIRGGASPYSLSFSDGAFFFSPAVRFCILSTFDGCTR